MSANSKPAPDRRPPVAVSYIRFSTPEQAKGDSLRRQTKATAEWCERNKVPLDDTIRDTGVSAYKGRHRNDTAELGRFLETVRAGRVPRGSYLVIENLDRLTREEERTALKVWIEILDAGVNIVQLNPETVFRHERSDMTDIIRAIIELSRGHSESRVKSARTLANWEQAVRLARESGRPVTGRLPGWVRLRKDRLELIPARAKTVRRIFEMCAAGFGLTSIVKKLKAENVKAFGGRERTEDGRTRKLKDDVYGRGEWLTSYVRSILSDRRVLGEYQPRDADGAKRGDVIPNYYPPAVSEADFYKARAGAAGRRNKPGAIGEGVANLFGGLMVNARDGDSYYAACRNDGGRKSRVLLNRSSVEGDSRAVTFPYAVFEEAVLSQLRELDPAEVLGSPRPGKRDVLEGELNWVRERKAALALELLKGDVAVVVDAIRGLEAREAELRGKLEGVAEAAAYPLARTFTDAQDLIDRMEAAPKAEREDIRLRLRAALRRLIESVHVLVVPRGRDRLASVQLNFRGTDHGTRRNYLIFHRSAAGNQNKLDPARSAVRSLKPGPAAKGGDGLFHVGGNDLTDPDDVKGVEAFLTGYPVAFVDRILAGKPLATAAEIAAHARRVRDELGKGERLAGKPVKPVKTRITGKSPGKRGKTALPVSR